MKVTILNNKKCINSTWIASFLASKNQECCECFGDCKVKVQLPNGVVQVLTEKEIERIKIEDQGK